MRSVSYLAGSHLTVFWCLASSSVRNRTYFGLLFPELFDDCQVFGVFYSFFAELSHHLRCLCYTGLDSFVSAQMGLHHLWDTQKTRNVSHVAKLLLWKTQKVIFYQLLQLKQTETEHFCLVDTCCYDLSAELIIIFFLSTINIHKLSLDSHSQIHRVVCMFVWHPLCLRRRQWARWCSGRGRSGHLWCASPSVPPEKHRDTHRQSAASFQLLSIQ